MASVTEPDVVTTDLQVAIAEGSRDTGMFGPRSQRHSLDFFRQKLAFLHPDHANDAERPRAVFGSTAFIHLTRADKLAQAISLLRADQTWLWHIAPDGTEQERLSPPQDPVYDAGCKLCKPG